jgi:hypothetical protein
MPDTAWKCAGAALVKEASRAATKEPDMKNRAYAVILAAAVALMAASGASARAAYVHTNVKPASHSQLKPAKKLHRRAVRGLV